MRTKKHSWKTVVSVLLGIALFFNFFALFTTYSSGDTESLGGSLGDSEAAMPIDDSPNLTGRSPIVGFSGTPGNTFLWFAPDGSDNKVDSIITAPLAADSWEGFLYFEFLPQSDLTAGELTFSIDMGAGFGGSLTIVPNDVFELTGQSGTVWSFQSKVAMNEDERASMEVKVSLTGMIRDLPKAADGSITYNQIELAYTAPGDTDTLGPLTLQINTQKDSFTLAKEWKNIAEAFPPGLADANLGEIYTHKFLNWELKAGQTAYTRKADGYQLIDTVPLASGGSIVSIRRDGTFLYDENGTYDAVALSGSNLSTGLVVINNPTAPSSPNATYSVIVKYPSQPAGTTVSNTGNLEGTYQGNSTSEVLATASAGPVDIGTGSGNGNIDPSSSFSISKYSVFYPWWQWGNPSPKWYGVDRLNKDELANGGFGFVVTPGKQLPGLGSTGGFTTDADVVVYDDVLTYGGRILDVNDAYLSYIKLPAFAGATGAKLYLKASYSDPWPATPTYDVSTLPFTQNIPADTYTYAKVVFEKANGMGSAGVEFKYQPTDSLTAEMGTTAEALLANYAGLDVLKHSDQTSAFNQSIAGNPTTSINKLDGSPLETLDSKAYQDIYGNDILRTLDYWRITDWLSFTYDLNAPSITWDSALEWYDFSYSHSLYLPGGISSPVSNMTYAAYLAPSVFLDEAAVYPGASVGWYQGGTLRVKGVDTSMVVIGGESRQRVILDIEYEGAPWQAPNGGMSLPVYTDDLDRYYPGSTVAYSAYIVIGDYAYLPSTNVNNAGWLAFRDKDGSGSVTPDQAKLRDPSNAAEQDWVYPKSRTDTIPVIGGISFSGVSKDIIDPSDGTATKTLTVAPGENWTYQIQVASNMGILKDVVVYDILPYSGDASYGSGSSRGSQFDVELVGVDLSSVTSSRQPIVYYSTSSSPDRNLAGGDWSTVQPAGVKSLAFDFGSAEFNGTTGLGPDVEKIYVTVRMASGSGASGESVYNDVFSTYQIKRGNTQFTGITPRDSRKTQLTLGATDLLIGSIVFGDSNENGILDPGEVGLPGHTVKLYRDSKTNLIGTTTTSSSGGYLFNVDVPGTYYVQFEKRPAEVFTQVVGTPAPTDIYTKVDPAAISGDTAFSTPISVSAADIASHVHRLDVDAGLSARYKVIYDANTGLGAPPVDGSSPYPVGATVTVLGQGAVYKDNHDFIGWNTQSDASGISYLAGQTFTITQDTTLYAIWQPTVSPPTYRVTYDANSGSGTVPQDPASYLGGTLVTVQDKGALYKPGNSFLRWDTAPDGSGDPYLPSQQFAIQRDMVFYAIWQPDSTPTVYYRVTYHANGGSGSDVVDLLSPYPDGSDVGVLGAGSLYRTGYDFQGWNTAPDGTGTGYAVGQHFTIRRDVDLYAQWKPSTSGGNNGGSGGGSNSGGGGSGRPDKPDQTPNPVPEVVLDDGQLPHGNITIEPTDDIVLQLPNLPLGNLPATGRAALGRVSLIVLICCVFAAVVSASNLKKRRKK
ncbi:MAG: InlB B-repeat-containing protein [Oscillospiraceae bacterium]